MIYYDKWRDYTFCRKKKGYWRVRQYTCGWQFGFEFNPVVYWGA